MNAVDRDRLLAMRRPEDLFPGDAAAAKKTYRELSLVWHPDRPAGAADVFAHLTALYREALDRLANGRWEGPSVVHIREAGGLERVYATRASAPFVFGHTLLCDDSVAYLFDPAHVAMFDRARRAPVSFKYASPRMREEFERYLPKVARATPTDDGRYLLQIQKTPDLIRLRDVVTHRSRLDAKHVAWIVSSLLNLTCYLSFANVVHHDISPDTYFVSPEHHRGALLGGWWAAQARGATVTQVPARTHAVMPFAAKLQRRASSLTDLELVRLTARECLASTAPEPMHTWVQSVGRGSAVDQYREWMEVLQRTFGPRRFVQMDLTAEAVYGREVVHG